MKFSTRQDTELPAEALFDGLTDFPRLEKLLKGRGVEVRVLEPGQAWHLAFDLQGRPRELDLRVAEMDRPEKLVVTGESEALDLTLTLTVVSLARARSRLLMEVEARPRNMRARLMLQTARLGKAQLDRQFEKRIGRFVTDLTAAG